MRTAWKCIYCENGKLWKCVIAKERVKSGWAADNAQRVKYEENLLHDKINNIISFIIIAHGCIFITYLIYLALSFLHTFMIIRSAQK